MGYVGDRSYINCVYFYVAMITLTGLSTLLVPVLKTFALLATYCASFGFFISANYALTLIIVVDLLGMDQMTNAYGFVSLFEGLANLVGPPLAGFIADTHSYDLTFYLSGAGMCIAAWILLVVPLLRRCDFILSAPDTSSDKKPVTHDNDSDCELDDCESEYRNSWAASHGGEPHVRFTEDA